MSVLKNLFRATVLCSIGLFGCGEGHDHDHDHAHAHGEGGDHGHKKGEGHGHDHHGPSHDLGTKEAAGMKISAKQRGAVTEGALSVKVDGANPADLILRVWLGSEDRSGSVVAKAEYHDEPDHKDFDAHVELPDPMPEGAQWWVEVQKGEEKFLLSFDVKK